MCKGFVEWVSGEIWICCFREEGNGGVGSYPAPLCLGHWLKYREDAVGGWDTQRG
jgi:hypothetical protein